MDRLHRATRHPGHQRQLAPPRTHPLPTAITTHGTTPAPHTDRPHAPGACLSRVRRRVACTVLRGVRRSNAPHLPDSHQPTRARERAMKKFTSPGGAQRFLSAFSGISPHFRPRRHRLTAAQYRHEMSTRFTTWNEVVGLPTTA